MVHDYTQIKINPTAVIEVTCSWNRYNNLRLKPMLKENIHKKFVALK